MYIIKMKRRSFIFIFLLIISLACSKEEVTPIENPSSESQSLFFIPVNFSDPIYPMANNPVTKAGFELGKALFNDPLLSRDQTISCSECHNQSYAFTHHGHALSHGIDGKEGNRNAPPIQNMAWQKEFFWDGGVGDLDLFPIAPIENPIEMDEKLGNVLAKLRKTSHYPVMFKKAFGSEEISSQRFLQALSQYMNSLISSNSKYDKVMRKEGEMFSIDEQAGFQLFQMLCASCHKGENFSDLSYRNNGLAINPKINDQGRYRITENKADLYKFKVPNLRNIEVTAPYMHDGRFNTLEDVLNHYTGEITNSETLDPLLKTGIVLNATEKRQLIVFLKTLTDKNFLTNTKLSN